jgi:hypothetical protein
LVLFYGAKYSFSPFSVADASAQTPNAKAPLRAIKKIARSLSSKQNGLFVSSIAASATSVTSCAGGGTTTVTSNAGYTAGTIAYDNCVDETGYKQHGSMNWKLLNWGSPYEAGEAFSFSDVDLTINDSGLVHRMTGKMDMGSHEGLLQDVSKVANANFLVAFADQTQMRITYTNYESNYENIAGFEDTETSSGSLKFNFVESGTKKEVSFDFDSDVSGIEEYAEDYPNGGNETIKGYLSSAAVAYSGSSATQVKVYVGLLAGLHGGSPIFTGTYSGFDDWLSH